MVLFSYAVVICSLYVSMLLLSLKLMLWFLVICCCEIEFIGLLWLLLKFGRSCFYFDMPRIPLPLPCCLSVRHTYYYLYFWEHYFLNFLNFLFIYFYKASLLAKYDLASFSSMQCILSIAFQDKIKNASISTLIVILIEIVNLSLVSRYLDDSV